MRGTPTRDALDGAITAITAAGCETPRLDAELLLADALGVSRERLLVDGDLVVEGPAVRVFQNAVRRRAVEREPVAYILGRRGFRRLELAADSRALIPRPETELLVEVGLGLPRCARVLDVGTGSGAVALALKDERPDLLVTGSDLSADALALARSNGERLGLAVSWLCADLLAGVPDEFDAILSNPPYVAESARSSLAPEILRHEPSAALFAGDDGLDVIRALLAQVGVRERVKLVALEIGAGQAGAVQGLARAAGFASVRAERDLAGIERVVVGTGREGAVVSLAPADAVRLEECLAGDGVAVIPTDTVYGLACNPASEIAVQRIYELKRRPPSKPAAVMFFALDQALQELIDLGPRTHAALSLLLPGPLTLLLPDSSRRYPLAEGASAGIGDGDGDGGGNADASLLGLRVPVFSGPLAALSTVRLPALQSSANFSGEPDPRSLREVPTALREGADLVLDGGELPGSASTVVDLGAYERTGRWRIVREGPVGKEELTRKLHGSPPKSTAALN